MRVLGTCGVHSGPQLRRRPGYARSNSRLLRPAMRRSRRAGVESASWRVGRGKRRSAPRWVGSRRRRPQEAASEGAQETGGALGGEGWAARDLLPRPGHRRGGASDHPRGCDAGPCRSGRSRASHAKLTDRGLERPYEFERVERDRLYGLHRDRGLRSLDLLCSPRRCPGRVLRRQ
jgi:hypothetical protein